MGRRRPIDRGATHFCCVGALSYREREENREASRSLSNQATGGALALRTPLFSSPFSIFYPPPSPASPPVPSPSDLKRRTEEAVAWLKRRTEEAVAWLKRRTEEAVATRLTAEPAMDAMKLAGFCDALPGKTLASLSCQRTGASRPRQYDLLQLLISSTTSTNKQLMGEERSSQDLLHLPELRRHRSAHVPQRLQSLHSAPWSPSAHEILGRMRQQRRRLLILQARLPAPPAPLFSL